MNSNHWSRIYWNWEFFGMINNHVKKIFLTEKHLLGFCLILLLLVIKAVVIDNTFKDRRSYLIWYLLLSYDAWYCFQTDDSSRLQNFMVLVDCFLYSCKQFLNQLNRKNFLLIQRLKAKGFLLPTGSESSTWKDTTLL